MGFPETWKAELNREKESWDLVVGGDVAEDEALQLFEDFLHKELNTKQHALYKGTITRCPKRLTSEHLYEVLAMADHGDSAFWVQFVTAKEVVAMYKDSEFFGFDDRAVGRLSGGSVPSRPDIEKVSNLAEMHTAAEKSRFNIMTFHNFVQDLSELLAIPIKELATIFSFIHCGRLILSTDVMEDFFLALGRQFNPGQPRPLTDNDFLALCLKCRWFDDVFNSGKALMCFMHVCRHRRKPSRSDHPSGKYKPPEKKKTEGAQRGLSKNPDAKTHIKTGDVEGGGRGKINTLEQFEFLLEYCAVCRKTSPIGMIVDLREAANAVLKEKPTLTRSISVAAVAKPKKSKTSKKKSISS